MSALSSRPIRSASTRSADHSRLGRIAITLAVLAALVPALIAGRQVTAQDTSGTPEASPTASSAATLQTASVVPADALLFAALTLDPTSGQITQSRALLDRAGLGDVVDGLFAEALGDMDGEAAPVADSTSAADATPTTDDPAPAAGPDLAAILDGEVAIAVTDQVLTAVEASLDDSASAVAASVDSVAVTDDGSTADEAIIEAGEESAETAEEALGDDAEGADDQGANTDDESTPLDNLATPESDIDGEQSSVDPSAPTTTESGVVAIVRPSDADAAEAEIDTLLQESSRADDAEIIETEASGATIRSLPADEFGSDGVAIVRLGDLFVVSGTPEDLVPYAAVAAGESPALSEDAAFTRARTELPDDFLAYGFVNGPAIVAGLEPLLAEASDAFTEAGLPPTGLSPEQLDQLRAYNAFIVRADSPGFRFETAMFAADGEELPALPEGGEVTLDSQVPGDSLVFVNGFELGQSLAPSLDSLAMLVAQAAAQEPSAAGLFPTDGTDDERIAAVYELAGRFLTFNPRADLLDQMTGEWAFALTIRSLTDPSGIGAVFTSGVDDPAAVTDATTKLAVYINLIAVALAVSADDPVGILSTTEAGASTEVVGDATTQIITIAIPPSTTGGMDTSDGSTTTDSSTATTSDEIVPTIRLQWGVIDGRFVFGVNEGFSDLTSGAASGVLADNPRYQAIMAELPTASNGVVFLDLGQLIALLEPVLYGSEGAAASGAPDLSGIEAFAAVSYAEGDVRGVSALLMIGE